MHSTEKPPFEPPKRFIRPDARLVLPGQQPLLIARRADIPPSMDSAPLLEPKPEEPAPEKESRQVRRARERQEAKETLARLKQEEKERRERLRDKRQKRVPQAYRRASGR